MPLVGTDIGIFGWLYIFFHRIMLNSCQRKSAETKRDKVFSFTVIIIIEKRKKTLIWPKNAPRVYGRSFW